MNKFLDYIIKRQNDGSFVVLRKDKLKNKVDIISHHDTYEKADDWLKDQLKPLSQSELIDFWNKNKINYDN